MTWRGRSIRSLLPMAAGVLLLVLASLLALFVVGRQQKAALSVRRTLIVEARLSHVQTLASDAESAQRGFLLTGRLDYLEPYLTARREFTASLNALKAENAGSVDALSNLEALLGQKMGELQKTIDLRQSGRNAEALAIVNTDNGARLMAAIRNGIDRMRSTEALYLEQQSDNAAFLSELTQEVLIATLVLLLGLGFLGLRDSRRRILELRSTNTALEFEAAERRSAEAQLRQLQKMEAVGQLTGGIAHDFNNMLAIVIGFLDLARRRLSAADPAILKYIDNATDGANRAVVLTKRLLAFSRQQPLQPTVIDVNKLVGGMSELLHRATGEAVLMETVLAAGLWRVHADAAQIENALVNLAVNARDAMPDGGRLTIETSNADLDERYAAAHNEVVAGQYVMISVTDTGAGMSASVLERAVDPFYTTKVIGKGTGLGLSQVFGFVKQSGGHLKLYSEVGQGTTAKIYLPRHCGNAAVVHEVEEVGLLQRGTGNRGDPGRRGRCEREAHDRRSSWRIGLHGRGGGFAAGCLATDRGATRHRTSFHRRRDARHERAAAGAGSLGLGPFAARPLHHRQHPQRHRPPRHRR